MRTWFGLLLAIGLLGALIVHGAGCAAIEKPCPECHAPNNPGDYPMPNDNLPSGWYGAGRADAGADK